MLKVLFVCVHNSARSQMAEAFFNQHATGIDSAESAGIKPGILNPYVIRAMVEKGIDISNNTTKGVFDLYKEGRTLSHVIAVCDEATQQCPIFPGVSNMLSWTFTHRFYSTDRLRSTHTNHCLTGTKVYLSGCLCRYHGGWKK